MEQNRKTKLYLNQNIIETHAYSIMMGNNKGMGQD